MPTTYEQQRERERRQRIAEHEAAEQQAKQEREEQLDRWRKENDRLRTERLKKLDAERDQKRREGEQRELETLKQTYRVRFMATPGATESEFEKAWPSLLEQHRISATLTEAEREKDALRQSAPNRYTM